MTVSDVFVKIRTASNGAIVVPSVSGGADAINELTRGNTSTLNLQLPMESLTVEPGETYTVVSGTTEIFKTVNVKEGGQLNIEEDAELIETGGDGLAKLQQYQDHAGSYVRRGSINNTHTFSLQIPQNIDISSLLVGVEPAADLQNNDVPGIWGLVSNITDARTDALSNEEVQIELDVLARYDEYSDHAAATNDLET